jgi:hypothetical protein
MKAPTRTTLVLVLLTLCWFGTAVAGFMWLARYKATPGDTSAGQLQWPDDCAIARVPGSFNFVLALNSHCPCSRATVGELARILDGHGTDVCLHVLVYHPSGFPDGWESSSLLDEVKTLPGAMLHVDIDAELATRFGLFTSGGLALYGVRGELLFEGGITAGRGHAGDTPAHDAIRARLLGETSEPFTAPVYGCPLRDPRS